MRIKQLQSFISVIEKGSIRAAARAIGVSQPVVTKSIRVLERDLGAPLFDRISSGARLSRFGEAFAPRARLLLSEMQRALDEIEQLRNESAGHVSVGITTSVAMTILPRAYSTLREQLPGSEIDITEDILPVLLRELLNGTFDFVVAELGSALVDPRLHCLDLFEVEVLICAKRSNPLLRARSLQDLFDAEWLVPSMGPAEDVVSLFAAHGMPAPRRIVQGRSVTIALSLVAQSDMIAAFVAPIVRSASPHHDIGIIRVREPLMPARMCVISREGETLTPIAERFLDRLAAAHGA